MLIMKADTKRNGTYAKSVELTLLFKFKMYFSENKEPAIPNNLSDELSMDIILIN